MEFFTVSNLKRPVRLCENTRNFAYESLNHKYGLDAIKNDSVDVSDIEGFENLSNLKKYDLCIRKIVEEAPVRICENEKLSGAANMGGGIFHAVPAKHKEYIYTDNFVFWSISHLTVDFEKVLKKGINGISDEIVASRKKHNDVKEIEFLDSCEKTVESMKIWHSRYLEELKNKEGYEDNYRNLCHVPFNPASNFYEAVQSIWFTFAFLRLCGNWPGFGRIDKYLGDYLKKDLKEGILTLDEAREILAHFFIKGCEWIKGGDCGSGDAQHYQNIVLSGIDENGNDVTNEVTYLVLDIVEETGISDFPVTIRLNSKTDDKLIRRASEVIRYGGGIIAFYNEEEILKSLTTYGYEYGEAVKFANDGCWEIQVPGKTYFHYCPFDALAILQKDVFKEYKEKLFYNSFEDIYNEYVVKMKDCIRKAVEWERDHAFNPDGTWKEATPCTAVSLFEYDCIGNAKSYLEGGCKYNVFSPHIGGLPDVVNSLYTIKKVVYDDKKYTLDEFCKILENDWAENEPLRRSILKDYEFYGNDNDECDSIAAKIIDDFAKACSELEGLMQERIPAGVSTFGRQLGWAPSRLASIHGHKKGEVLAANYSPTPGSDKKGATAIIKSYCKSDLTKMVTGAALDIRLLPSSVEGDDGLDALVSLMKGFVALGGNFVQPDVQDVSVLRDAQNNPENYQTLSVRVSGWNARFVTLNRDWQDMIIQENDK